MTLVRLDVPLGATLQARCPYCPWRRLFDFGPSGYNMASILLLGHVERRHPRAWRRHCRTTRAPAAVTVNP